MANVILAKCDVEYFRNRELMNLMIDYAVRTKLILYGGLAIHHLIKDKNGIGIYDPELIPDCDYYSYDFVTDSNNFANELYKLDKYSDISVIHALHQCTRKLRVEMVNITDITQITLKPDTVDIKDGDRIITCVGLLYVKIPIFYVLAHPYGTELLEHVYTRYSKDEQRLELLDTHYPTYDDVIVNSSDASKEIECLTIKHADLCISGILAYCYYYELASENLKSKLIKITYDGKIITYPRELKDRILFTYYGDLKNALESYPNAICKTGCTDMLPESILIDDKYELYSDRLNITCHHEINGKKILQLYHLAFLFGMYYYMFDNKIYSELVDCCRKMQKSKEKPEYGYAIRESGDINNNYRSQQYMYEISCRNRPDERLPHYYPNREVVEEKSDDTKPNDMSSLLKNYTYQTVTKSELIRYY